MGALEVMQDDIAALHAKVDRLIGMVGRKPAEPRRDALLTRKEAAAYVGVTEGTLAVWHCEQEHDDLPVVKVGRSVRYKQSDLDAFLERRTKRPGA